MASSDIVESAAKAYRLAWSERRYLVKLAIVPVIVKLACFIIIMMLSWEREYIKQALVMLPSYFTEGWLLAHLVRFIYFGQRWPFRPTGNEDKDALVLQERARGIAGGAVLYTLIRFLQNGMFAIIQSGSSPAGEDIMTVSEEPTLALFVMALIMLAGIIWTFRFFWLFIPAAANYPIRRFIWRTNGFSTSLHLMATWTICFFPLVFLLLSTTSQILSLHGSDVTSIPVALDFILSIFQVVINTVIAIITTAGIAYAIKAMFQDIQVTD